jgi:type II secretory pathway pseudopilin PulG
MEDEMCRGVSLIELMIGGAIAGAVIVGVARFIDNSKNAEKNAIARAKAESTMRVFIESHKKHLATARNPYLGAGPFLNLPFQNRNCSFLNITNPSFSNCGDSNLNFNQLSIDRFYNATAPTTYFTQNVTTQCVAQPVGVAITQSDSLLIRNCTPCANGQVPIIRIMGTNQPGVVKRFSDVAENATNANNADDGVSLAASLCVTHEPLSNPADPNSFRILNLRIRTLVRQNKSVRLLELTSSAPLPTQSADGVRVLSSGH